MIFSLIIISLVIFSFVIFSPVVVSLVIILLVVAIVTFTAESALQCNTLSVVYTVYESYVRCGIGRQRAEQICVNLRRIWENLIEL